MKHIFKRSALIGVFSLIVGCTTIYAKETDTGEKVDFTKLQSPGEQEEAYTYEKFFLPEKDLFAQPYTGDVMPYYEDGVFYIYYLKDGGDSLNHSIYLATTTDFVTYTEQDEPVLESAQEADAQDNWIGTGSVVKIKDTYYLFYTGHASDPAAEYKEKILLAKSDNLYSFEKVPDWEMIPAEEIGQKNDFRDPQVYYDPEKGEVVMTVTAAIDGTARIVKYTLPEDLTDYHYDGVIFTNTDVECWNLECSDTFCIGDTWYLTYSAQDDTLWYAMAEKPYGPYSPAERLDGKLFYAAKHVEDGENLYMAGWARRADPVSSKQVAAWAGNLVVQKLVQKEDGRLALQPVDAIMEKYSAGNTGNISSPEMELDSSDEPCYEDAFMCEESYMVSGKFSYSGSGCFGLCFDMDGTQEHDKKITINPKEGAVQLHYENGKLLIAETKAELRENETYTFTYIQEGSVGTFYVGNEAALTVRVYGATGKKVRLFADNIHVSIQELKQYY